MKKYNTTVVIVGGGPAGATVARIVSQNGIDNILVEKNLAFHKPCGGGISIGAFDEFDIPKSLIKKNISTIKIVSPLKNSVNIPLENSPLAIVDRVEFDKKLRYLAKEAGSKIIEGSFKNIKFLEDQPTIFVETKKESIQIDAKYIVAADGVNSLIRKLVIGTKPNRALTWYAHVNDKNSSSCEFWFGQKISPQNYAWIFPHNNGAHIGNITFDEKGIGENFRNFLKEADINQKVKHKGYYIPVWKNSLFYRKKIFFVGDAAEQVLPFTYEGIYYAMKSAKILSQAIIENKPLLYEKVWKKELHNRFVFMRRVQRIFLKNDYLAEKLVSLHKSRSFQKVSLKYWTGEKSSNNRFSTYWKILKSILSTK
jgi:geranylgeranyl reductase